MTIRHVSCKATVIFTCTNIQESPGPEVVNLFSCSTQLSMKFILLINLKILTFFLNFFHAQVEHEKNLIVGIFIFMTK